MGILMMANFAVVGINVVLLSVLLVLYGRMMRQAATRFTLGLLLFAGALWTQCAVQLYFMATRMPLFVGGLEGIVLAQNLLALLASAFLLSVTLNPVGRLDADTAHPVDPDVS